MFVSNSTLQKYTWCSIIFQEEHSYKSCWKYSYKIFMDWKMLQPTLDNGISSLWNSWNSKVFEAFILKKTRCNKGGNDNGDNEDNSSNLKIPSWVPNLWCKCGWCCCCWWWHWGRRNSKGILIGRDHLERPEQQGTYSDSSRWTSPIVGGWG